MTICACFTVIVVRETFGEDYLPLKNVIRFHGRESTGRLPLEDEGVWDVLEALRGCWILIQIIKSCDIDYTWNTCSYGRKAEELKATSLASVMETVEKLQHKLAILYSVPNSKKCVHPWELIHSLPKKDYNMMLGIGILRWIICQSCRGLSGQSITEWWYHTC